MFPRPEPPTPSPARGRRQPSFTIRPRDRAARVDDTLSRCELPALFRSGIGSLFDYTTPTYRSWGCSYGGVVAELTACVREHAVEVATTGLPTAPRTPSTVSRPLVAAVGWGDLVVARESLVGYTAREIAHIENILPGETKLREHERRSHSEEVQESEILTERETEKDSQSTDRYELQAQSQEAINQSFSVSAGVKRRGNTA